MDRLKVERKGESMIKGSMADWIRKDVENWMGKKEEKKVLKKGESLVINRKCM